MCNWVKKLFTVNILFAAIFLMGARGNQIDYCKYTYEFGDQSVICSREPIDKEQAEKKLSITQKLYPKYLADHSKVITNYQNLIIIVISEDDLNNEELFHDGEHKRYLGRYYRSTKLIYITPSALEPHNTDLAHELVHYLNAINGITDKTMDESLAYKFEAYYVWEY